MINAQQIIEDGTSLPVEERVKIVASLLETINPSSAEMDRQWAAVAKERLAEHRSGTVKSIPPEVPFAD